VHRVVRHRPKGGMDMVLPEIAGAIRELIASSPVDAKKIQGVAVGLPGIVDERAGTVRHNARDGVRNSYIAVRDQLEAEFGLPVLMGNDATLSGYGELRLGLDRHIENFVYLYSDMGASLIFNGHIYWGSGGSAGELGVFIPSDDDYLAWIKAPAFLRPSVWNAGLIQQARQLAQDGHATAIQGLANGSIESIGLDTVIQAAQEGDVLARELVEHHSLQLGVRIANLVNLLNPDVVVIGGGIERAGSMLLEPVWRAVKKYAYEEQASLVDVLPAQLGEDAAALGAACWVIREVFVQA
jgi:glucokinase